MLIEKSLKYQRERYNKEAADYECHHNDPINQQYRTQFIRNKIFNINISGKKVLDAMCASGIETGYLLDKNADVIGLDISDENGKIYMSKWGRECLIKSIHETGLENNSFDLVYICGGLHHVLPLLNEVFTEIHRILKPGGHFCFLEPNKDTWLNSIRNIWYRFDRRFHETEAAISYKNQLKPFLKLGFHEEYVFTGGNVAYVLISQSLILGIPASVKRFIYKPLFILERIFNHLPFSPKLYIAARWKKQINQ